MATNLTVDNRFIEQALNPGGFKTKKETVNTALREFINRRKQLEIIELFLKLDPDPNYTYKKGR